jgi:hypothetical protein
MQTCIGDVNEEGLLGLAGAEGAVVYLVRRKAAMVLLIWMHSSLVLFLWRVNWSSCLRLKTPHPGQFHFNKKGGNFL